MRESDYIYKVQVIGTHIGGKPLKMNLGTVFGLFAHVSRDYDDVCRVHGHGTASRR